MNASLPASTTQTLPPDVNSVRAARRLVSETLPDAFEQRDLCLLLVSEAVTNAILHAGTELELRCKATPEWARIEVVDGSSVTPVRRDYGAEGRTGRGMALIEELSSGWGVEHRDDGKVVWFELGKPPPGIDPLPASSGPAIERATVTLVRPPLLLLPATLEYADAVLRELALLRLSGQLLRELPDGWRVPPLDTKPVLDALRRAAAEPLPDAIAFDLPADAASAALERLALVSLGDQVASGHDTMLPPPLPEISQCRYWFLTEIAAQLGGAEPRAWTQPELGTPTDPAVPFTTAGVPDLTDQTKATVVADDTNRILLANPAALDLLGWDATLVGQRLTTIIPPELRERHLAGFARVGLGGRPHLIGKPTSVPALRRDGTDVLVVLTLSLLARSGRRRLYMGQLELA